VATAVALDGEEVERLVSWRGVADRLDCSERTVRNLVKRGEFMPPMSIGNMPRWRERDVNAWIAARATRLQKIEAAAAKSLAPRVRRG